MLDLETVFLLILFAWIYIVPIVALVMLFIASLDRIRSRRWLAASAVCALLWTPMLGNMLNIWSTFWPLPDGIVRSSVDLPGYRVEFVSNGIFSDASEYFDVIRSDGKRGFVNIDYDANVCRDLKQMREGSRIYFVCGTESTPSYVDIEQGLVYTQSKGTTTRLIDLQYSDPE